MFNRLFKKDPMKAPARAVYTALVEAARRPIFYGLDGAPDTVDGRFDLIILHAILVFRQVRSIGEEGKHFNQLVFDILFDDMDAALREMGTGDLSVGKKIREMGEAFYGRARAYEAAIDENEVSVLAVAIERNLFAREGDDTESDVAADPEPSLAANRLAAYAMNASAYLQDQNVSDILRGVAPRFPSAL